jgi:uncharacterized protein (TIGR03000 family)
MNRTHLLVAALLTGCTILLGLPGSAAAYVYRSYSSYHPVYPAGAHMPGWDWWRIYPWSPYNYGRNPYNPIVLPYPVPAPYYPPYVPGAPAVSYPVAPPDGTMYSTQIGRQLAIPHPTGGYTVPPADAAVIEVRVPDNFAQVLFNGERTYTMGNTRWFVTPDLAVGKEYTYTITASWTQNGQPVTREKQVKVARGQTTVVDFVRPSKP